MKALHSPDAHAKYEPPFYKICKLDIKEFKSLRQEWLVIKYLGNYLILGSICNNHVFLFSIQHLQNFVTNECLLIRQNRRYKQNSEQKLLESTISQSEKETSA